MTRLSDKVRRRKLVQDAQPQDLHLIGIGLVALRSAILDLMIEMTFDEITRSYTPSSRKKALNRTILQKLEEVEKVFIEELPDCRHAISEFMLQIRLTREHRNDIIHRVWMNTDVADEKRLIDPTTWKQPKKTRTSTVKSLNDLAISMIDLFFEFGDWKRLIHQMRMKKSGQIGKIMPIGFGTPPRTSSADRKDGR